MELRKIDIGTEVVKYRDGGKKPDLDFVDLSLIVINDEYQRPLLKSNWNVIKKIAENFTWTRFSPVILSRMADGRYALVDGQHRCHAAALCGIKIVPALITEAPVQEQASAFSWINGNTTKITLFHVYKAALAAREDWALRSREAVELAGAKLMTFNSSTALKKSGEVYALALVRQLVDQGKSEHVTAALRALRDYDEHMSRVALWSAVILRPWLMAVASDDRHLKMDLLGTLRYRDPYRVLKNVDRIVESGEMKEPRATLERKAFVALIRDPASKK